MMAILNLSAIIWRRIMTRVDIESGGMMVLISARASSHLSSCTRHFLTWQHSPGRVLYIPVAVRVLASAALASDCQ